jgi:hypothetical protein
VRVDLMPPCVGVAQLLNLNTHPPPFAYAFAFAFAIIAAFSGRK